MKCWLGWKKAMVFGGIAFLGSLWQAEAADIAGRLRSLPNFPEIRAIVPLSGSGGTIMEVQTAQGQIMYTDSEGRFLILGQVIDVDSRENLTRKSVDEMWRISWDDLPFGSAIREVRGKGTRKLAVFTDPYCGFCARMEEEIQKLDDVTVYYFLIGMSEESQRVAGKILCSQDALGAYHGWMRDHKEPEGNCTAERVKANLDFAGAHGIQGTPTLYFGDGSRFGGYADSGVIESRLQKVHGGGKK